MVIPLDDILFINCDGEQRFLMECYIRGDWSKQRDLEERRIHYTIGRMVCDGFDFQLGLRIRNHDRYFRLVKLERDENDERKNGAHFWAFVFDDDGPAPPKSDRPLSDSDIRCWSKKRTFIHNGATVIKTKTGWMVAAGPSAGVRSSNLEKLIWQINHYEEAE